MNRNMNLSTAIIKNFGNDLFEKNKDNIPELIALIEKKVEELRDELAYLTMMVDYGNLITFDNDPEEACGSTDDSENAVLLINMTTLRIKELESSLLALRQIETKPTARVS